MGAMKRELDRRNADLESLVASHQENLDSTGTDLNDTGVTCGCAVLRSITIIWYTILCYVVRLT